MKKLLNVLTMLCVFAAPTCSVLMGVNNHTPNPNRFNNDVKRPLQVNSKFVLNNNFTFGYKTKEDYFQELKTGQPTLEYWNPGGYPEGYNDTGLSVNSLFTWSPKTDVDAKFNRSTVPLSEHMQIYHQNFDGKMLSNSKQDQTGNVRHMEIGMVDPANTNIPSQGFLGSFNGYNFSNWQYVNIYVAWKGSAYDGIVCIPNAGFVDAAHKNGVPVLGTIFFDGWSNLSHDDLKNMFSKNADGTYKLTNILLTMAKYYGFDGWFWNQESLGQGMNWNKEVVDVMQQFEAKKLESLATKNLLMVSYLPNMPLSRVPLARDYLQTLTPMQDGTNFVTKTADYEDVNASGNDYHDLVANGEHNEFKNREWDLFNQQDIGGNFRNQVETGQSIPALRESASYNNKYSESLTSFSSADTIKWAPENLSKLYPNINGLTRNLDINYLFQKYESNFAVGKTSNPLTDTDDNLATIIGEKTSLITDNFITNFSTGNGVAYYENGIKTGNNNWNNRSVADIMPTFQWIINNDNGNNLQANFDYRNAFNKGNSIVLSGKWDFQKADFAGGQMQKDSSTTIDLFGTHILKFDQNINLKFKANNSAVDVAKNVHPQFMIQGLDFDGNAKTFISNDDNAKISSIANSNGWYDLSSNLATLMPNNEIPSSPGKPPSADNDIKEITNIAVKLVPDQNFNDLKINLGQFSISPKNYLSDLDFVQNININYAITNNEGANLRIVWDNVTSDFDNYEIYTRDENNHLIFKGTTRENAFYLTDMPTNKKFDLCVKANDQYNNSNNKMTCQTFEI